MIKKFGVQCGPVTKQIFVGKLNKQNNLFVDKEDCTLECITAVIDFLLKSGGDVTLHSGEPHKPDYTITLLVGDKPKLADTEIAYDFEEESG